jgi:hypothetical protein
MNNFFLVLFLLSFVGLVIGLIKPQWVKMQSRKHVTGVFVGAMAVFVVLGAITSPLVQSSTTATTRAQRAPNAPQAATQSVNATPLRGNVKYTFESGYGYITITNEDSFDWHGCVFSDTALDTSNPHDILKGQSYEIAAIDFRINPQVYTSGPMSISNFDFMHSKSIETQCQNGQIEIGDVYQNFAKIAPNQ